MGLVAAAPPQNGGDAGDSASEAARHRLGTDVATQSRCSPNRAKAADWSRYADASAAHGHHFVLDDRSDRMPVDAGLRDNNEPLVGRAALAAIQARYDRGLVHASSRVNGTGDVIALAPLGGLANLALAGPPSKDGREAARPLSSIDGADWGLLAPATGTSAEPASAGSRLSDEKRIWPPRRRRPPPRRSPQPAPAIGTFSAAASFSFEIYGGDLW